MNETETRLLQTIDALRDQQIALTQDIVRIKTVNPYSGDDSAHIETEGQQWIAEKFRALGAKVRNVPVPDDVYERGGMIGPAGRSWDGRENVIAEWTLGTGEGRTILLNNHMDTVGTDGMEIDPFDPVIRDGKMFGRGTSDTKGSTIAGLTAVEALLKNADGLNGKIVFEVVVDEECNGAGAGTLACCLAGVGADADFAICLDGAHGVLYNGCNGIATARVIVRGQAGHSSHGISVSAIDKGIAAKAGIDRFGAAYQQKHDDCNYTVGVFRAGTLPAIVPGVCEIQINLNYNLNDAIDAEKQGLPYGGALYRKRFEDAMAALKDSDEWFAKKPVEVSWIKDMYPFACAGDDDLTQTVLDAIGEVEGEPQQSCRMSAWCDAAHIARHRNIPLLGVSSGTPGQAHSSGEHVLIDDLHAAARGVALSLHRLLS